ncbi:APC family permease [Acidobacteriota bacterium]
MEDSHLKRSIGLPGAVFILVGYIVGASIYILPGTLGATAGPGVFVSYLLASVLAIFTCFVTAQVGSAFPTSGANYVAISRVLSPFWGYMFIWALIACMGVGLPLIAYGFAEYLSFFIPVKSPMLVAAVIMLLFTGVNLLGVEVAKWIQAIMVVEFIAALLIFAVVGLFNLDNDLLTPVFPAGFGAVVMMAIPAYFSFVGFFMIAEIGEEIKNPSRNIPRALLISFVVVVIVYTIVPLVVTGVLPWETLGGTKGAVAVASNVFFPKWLANIIAISALFAVATSINGIIVAQARDFFAVARDGVFPSIFSRVSKRFSAPYWAILLAGGIALVGILFGASIQNYAIMTVLGFMIIQILAGLAVLNLPKRLPDRYKEAKFKLKGFALPFFSIGLIVVSVVFIVIGIEQSLISALIYLAFVALGAVGYVLRKRILEKQGQKLEEMLTKDLSDIL